MHYFAFHIGDYVRKTHHLSLLEDAILMRCIRKIYSEEKALPPDIADIARAVGARQVDEINAVHIVVKEFFELRADGWMNHRCEEELAKYKSYSDAGRAGATARWDRYHAQLRVDKQSDSNAGVKRSDSDGNATAMRSHSDGNANHKPITNNQKTKKGTRLADDWRLPEAWKAWANAHRPELDADAIAAKFADHWHATAGAKGIKADWSATWRNFVRNERIPLATRDNASPMTVDWARTNEGIDRKGREIGLPSRPGEDYGAYKARIVSCLSRPQ